MTKRKQKTESNPIGRPTDYCLETSNTICSRLVAGESLNSISKDKAMPSIVTIYAWMRKFPEFLKNYEEAKANQIDTLADEILEISDNKDEGKVQRDRLRIDTRKWIAERMKPKKYGAVQKLEVEDVTIDQNKRKGIIERIKSRSRS